MEKEFLKSKEYLRAKEFGVDIDLIETNLKLTYEERIDQHQFALDFMLECEEAGRKLYARIKKNS